MIKVSDIKSDKRFPAFISQHGIFNSHKTYIKKIFPEIGLSNFSEDISLDNFKEVSKNASFLLTAIVAELIRRDNSITTYHKKNGNKFSDNRKAVYAKVTLSLKSLAKLIKKSHRSFINVNQAGKLSINLPSDIVDKDLVVLFRRGEGLFKVYNKINSLLEEGLFARLPMLETYLAFKAFSSVNIPNSKLKIVFSSDGIEGAWDLATMSMRGITSCQSWSSGNSINLIGSIIDPCTAIMYLTSGSKSEGDKGVKMTRRCIVRFAIRNKDKRPVLLLERMYPSFDKEMAKKFIEILKKKTNNKYSVIDLSQNKDCYTVKIPLAPILRKIESSRYPYRDSGALYESIPSEDDLEYIKRGVLQKLNSAMRDLSYKAGSALVKMKAPAAEKDKNYLRFLKRDNNVGISYFRLVVGDQVRDLCRRSVYKTISHSALSDGRLEDIIVLDIAKTAFDAKTIDFIIDKSIKQLYNHCSIKPSEEFLSALKEKSKENMQKEFDKQIKLLFIKAEKTKVVKNKVSDEVIALLHKVS